jgi:hypothetical protein
MNRKKRFVSFTVVGKESQRGDTTMSFGTPDSAIRMTPALEKEISEALPDQIKSIMARAAIEQSLVTADSYNPSILIPTALADHAPQKFSKYVTINNTKYLLEGGSPEELANAETSLYEQVLGQGDNGQARDAQGRFVHEQTPEEKAAGELEASKRADLELAWKRGDITTEQYLEKSGAINTYLTEHGMNPDALATVSDAIYQNTWAAATEAFLNSPQGESWPGGQTNMELMGRILEENNMTEPTVENLSAAFQYASENGLLVENPETAAHHAISEANSVEDIRTALNRPTQSSGLFNYR